MENKQIQRLREKLNCFAEIYEKLAVDLRDKEPERSERCAGEAEIFREAAEAVARMETVEPEIEGSVPGWFYVCGECHGPVSPPDHFCRFCGRPLGWGKLTSGNTRD